jgi:diguanylate cyclase (GGDEF)-like protein
MSNWHKLLQRQLRRHSLLDKAKDSGYVSVLNDVSSAYSQADEDRVLLERSLELMSKELTHRNQDLQTKINEAALAEAQLKESFSLLQATLDSSSEGVLVIRENRHVDICNQALLNMFNLTMDDFTRIIGDDFFNNLKPFVKNHDAIKSEIINLYQGDDEFANFTIELKNKSILDCYAAPRMVDNKIIGRVWNIRDVTQLRRSERETHYNANHDRLTGLPNRTLFRERLEAALKFNKTKHKGLAVLFLDLDEFKIINDSLGHEAGDELLKKVSGRLRDVLHDADVLSRHGGDEFVLMLQGVGNIKSASASAERIINLFESPFEVAGKEIYISTSIGIALTPNDGNTHSLLIRNSDMAMYHAKSRGRNNFQFFSEDLERLSSHRLRIKNDLKLALEKGEFHLVYQPKVSLSDGSIMGVEALIRWEKNGKLIPPMEFIPIAEDHGLIVEISEWVIENSCQQIKRWSEAGFKDVKVAINISPRHFERGTVLSDICNAVEKYGIDKKNIEIEITETAVMDDINVAMLALQKVKDEGITIAIDDFGTGYSSLNYLKRLPINVVKIDKSFIDELTVSPVDSAMVFSIITLAHLLGYKVVAEGVEDEETMQVLKTMHCDYFQGYFFSWPVSASDLTEMLKCDTRLKFE